MKKTEVEEAIDALKKIAMMGSGIKAKDKSHDWIHYWANIGRDAVHLARVAVAGKCPTCNKPKDYIMER